MNLITYLGNSFFDNEYYQIKRKRLTEYNDDISNKEQTLLQSCSHDNLSRYVMSFYLNRSIYIFFSATSTTLHKSLPIKNQPKALGIFLQLCKGVKYLHDKNLVYGIFNSQGIFVNKNRAFLSMNNLYEVNKYGAAKNYKEKRVLVQSANGDWYLPPEESFSKEGDVWSLGILLHEIITGMLPFNKKDGRFQLFEDCIDPFLTKILQRALRRDPIIRIKL